MLIACAFTFVESGLLIFVMFTVADVVFGNVMGAFIVAGGTVVAGPAVVRVSDVAAGVAPSAGKSGSGVWQMRWEVGFSVVPSLLSDEPGLMAVLLMVFSTPTVVDDSFSSWMCGDDVSVVVTMLSSEGMLSLSPSTDSLRLQMTVSLQCNHFKVPLTRGS